MFYDIFNHECFALSCKSERRAAVRAYVRGRETRVGVNERMPLHIWLMYV